MAAPSGPHRLPADGPTGDKIIGRSHPVPAQRLYGAFIANEQSPMLKYLDPMGEDLLRFWLFNKNHPSERICPHCKLHYYVAKPAITRVEQEQELSGICSSACFVGIQGGAGYDVNEWLGESADRLHRAAGQYSGDAAVPR